MTSTHQSISQPSGMMSGILEPRFIPVIGAINDFLKNESIRADTLQEEVIRLREEKDNQAEKINGLREEKDDQAEQIKGLREEKEEQAREIQGLRQESDEQAEEIKSLREELIAKEAQLTGNRSGGLALSRFNLEVHKCLRVGFRQPVDKAIGAIHDTFYDVHKLMRKHLEKRIFLKANPNMAEIENDPSLIAQLNRVLCQNTYSEFMKIFEFEDSHLPASIIDLFIQNFYNTQTEKELDNRQLIADAEEQLRICKVPKDLKKILLDFEELLRGKKQAKPGFKKSFRKIVKKTLLEHFKMLSPLYTVKNTDDQEIGLFSAAGELLPELKPLFIGLEKVGVDFMTQAFKMRQLESWPELVWPDQDAVWDEYLPGEFIPGKKLWKTIAVEPAFKMNGKVMRKPMIHSQYIEDVEAVEASSCEGPMVDGAQPETAFGECDSLPDQAVATTEAVSKNSTKNTSPMAGGSQIACPNVSGAEPATKPQCRSSPSANMQDQNPAISTTSFSTTTPLTGTAPIHAAFGASSEFLPQKKDELPPPGTTEASKPGTDPLPTSPIINLQNCPASPSVGAGDLGTQESPRKRPNEEGNDSKSKRRKISGQSALPLSAIQHEVQGITDLSAVNDKVSRSEATHEPFLGTGSEDTQGSEHPQTPSQAQTPPSTHSSARIQSAEDQTPRRQSRPRSHSPPPSSATQKQVQSEESDAPTSNPKNKRKTRGEEEEEEIVEGESAAKKPKWDDSTAPGEADAPPPSLAQPPNVATTSTPAPIGGVQNGEPTMTNPHQNTANTATSGSHNNTPATLNSNDILPSTSTKGAMGPGENFSREPAEEDMPDVDIDLEAPVAVSNAGTQAVSAHTSSAAASNSPELLEGPNDPPDTPNQASLLSVATASGTTNSSSVPLSNASSAPSASAPEGTISQRVAILRTKREPLKTDRVTRSQGKVHPTEEASRPSKTGGKKKSTRL